MAIQRKIHIARWLMYSSLLVLVVFEGYWLKNEYTNEFRSLRREAGIILRESTLKIQFRKLLADSSIKTIASDKVNINLPSQTSITFFENNDTSTSKGVTSIAKNVIIKLPNNHDTFIVTEGSRLKTRILTTESNKSRYENISIMMVQSPVQQELLATGKIQKIYQEALEEAQIKLPFTLKKIDWERPDDSLRNRSDFYRMPMGGRKMGFVMAEANFGNPFWFIILRMGWQFLLASFMIGITTTAFIFMFRSLKKEMRLTVLKNDFINNMTHELKTPIATVGVAIEALKNFHSIDDAAKTNEYLDISGKELQRLNLLVDKVLRITMFEQNHLKIQYQQVILFEIATEVLKNMQVQFELAKAIFTLNGNSSLAIKGDRMHLQSVLYNLVDNALKYGGKPPEIHISIRQSGNKTILEVQDNGTGIPLIYKDKIFEKFFRIPSGNQHDTKGYGLGLSYVAEVVKQHGGTISVCSKPENGSTFTIEF